MYANDFEYYRATSVAEAVELLVSNEGAEPMAGSHGLLPRMRTGEEAPPVLVDINGIDGLRSIEETEAGLSIGALTTHAEIARSELVQTHAPALAVAAQAVGDIQVRNGGSIGGNLAHGDPRADLPAAVLALGGSVSVTGPDGSSSIDATELFHGDFKTEVDDHEIVTAVEIPVAANTASTYVKHRNPLSGYPLIGVGAWVQTDDGGETIEAARVAATGNLVRSMRLEEVENALIGSAVDKSTIDAAVAEAAVDEELYRQDPQASAAYCNHLLAVRTAEALDTVLAIETN